RLACDLFRLRLSGKPDHAKLDRNPNQLEKLALPVGVGACRFGGLYLPRIPGLGLVGSREEGDVSGALSHLRFRVYRVRVDARCSNTLESFNFSRLYKGGLI